jgi:phosphoribosyl-ATP pyrophosphohydrolase/phosphoribosyl-AMP cyclohydrolase
MTLPASAQLLTLDTLAQLDFAKGDGLLPAIVQDAHTHRVLMLGYQNHEAVRRTLEEHRVWFWSRTRQRLWLKGETSGHVLHLHRARIDCDHDTLLLQATPAGPVCHTGADTCFGEANPASGGFLHTLQQVVAHRATAAPTDSYTARLLARGLHKVAQKVGEEAVEVVIEALRNDRERLLEESADLLFHLSVLWHGAGVSLSEIEAVLHQRHVQ